MTNVDKNGIYISLQDSWARIIFFFPEIEQTPEINQKLQSGRELRGSTPRAGRRRKVENYQNVNPMDLREKGRVADRKRIQVDQKL